MDANPKPHTISNADKERRLETIRNDQRWGLAGLFGVLAAAATGGAWIGASLWTGTPWGWMTLLIGFVTGRAVRIGGRGTDANFGIFSAALTVVVLYLCQEVLRGTHETRDFFQWYDWGFIFLGVVASYVFAYREVTAQELESLITFDTLDETVRENYLNRLREAQNWSNALLYGAGAALAYSLLWLGLIATTERIVAWMAIGAGYAIGAAIQIKERPIDDRFGWLSVGLTGVTIASAYGMLEWGTAGAISTEFSDADPGFLLLGLAISFNHAVRPVGEAELAAFAPHWSNNALAMEREGTPLTGLWNWWNHPVAHVAIWTGVLVGTLVILTLLAQITF